jgi:hypothetical protein
MVNEDLKKPKKVYRAGLIHLNVWENSTQEGVMKSFSISRAYKDKNDNWQHTTSFKLSDLPKLKLLVEKAYEENMLN